MAIRTLANFAVVPAEASMPIKQHGPSICELDERCRKFGAGEIDHDQKG
jgi:hypothetical protein